MPSPTLSKREIIAQQARRLTSNQMAGSRVAWALKNNTPPAADSIYYPLDNVLVWREKQVENRIGEWLSPFVVISVDDDAKIILI